MGRTPMGPVNRATLTLNLADYTSKFGAMSLSSPVSYQANGFFNNGGEQAVIVRLFSPPSTSTTSKITVGGTVAATDIYTVNYVLNGVPGAIPVSAPASPTVNTMAAAIAAALPPATTTGPAAPLAGVINASNTSGTPDVALAMAGPGNTQTFEYYVTVAGTGTVQTPASGLLNNGCAVLPVYGLQATVTISGTMAPEGGDVFTLDLTPVGGKTSSVSYKTVTGDTASSVATGLYKALQRNQVVTAAQPASGSAVLPLAYSTTNLTAIVGTVTAGTGGSGQAVQVAYPAAATFTLGGTLTPGGGDVFTLNVVTPTSTTVGSYSYGPSTSTDTFATIAQALANKLQSMGAFVSASSSTAATVTLVYPASAIILAAPVTNGGSASHATLTVGTPPPSSLFTLTAAALGSPNPGTWGSLLSASISIVSPTTYASLYKQYSLSTSDPTQAMFNLTVVYNSPLGPQAETFSNVTLYGTSNQTNRLDNILANGSQYVGWTVPSNFTPPVIPTSASGSAAGGADSAGLQSPDYEGDPDKMTGLYALNQLPYGWNILSVPPDDDLDDPINGGDWEDLSVYQLASTICVANNAMLILDPPQAWYQDLVGGNIAGILPTYFGTYAALEARASAVYFPRIIIADPLRNGLPRTLVPSGYMAAAWAANDTAFGVWKAPAGLSSPIGGIIQLQANLTNAQNGVLNPLGINCLRYFPGTGNVVWGARTLQGDDQLADQYKYIPVQRLVDYIQTSLLSKTQWAVFQPNGQALWTMLQTQINTFMASLFSQGAFAGTSASQAYFVKCDTTTTSPANQAAGIVNVQVGFAPLYPAEFVVITISQISQTPSS